MCFLCFGPENTGPDLFLGDSRIDKKSVDLQIQNRHFFSTQKVSIKKARVSWPDQNAFQKGNFSPAPRAKIWEIWCGGRWRPQAKILMVFELGNVIFYTGVNNLECFFSHRFDEFYQTIFSFLKSTQKVSFFFSTQKVSILKVILESTLRHKKCR